MITNKKDYDDKYSKLSIMTHFYDNGEYFNLYYKINNNNKAILWLHGFNDYFYHVHMIDIFLQNGYDLYCISFNNYLQSCSDRKYAFYTDNLKKYYPDIDNSIKFILENNKKTEIILKGHSTGGLIATHYCYDGLFNKKISKLVLNSPFFDFDDTNQNKYLMEYFVYYIGKSNPKYCIREENKLTINKNSNEILTRYYFDTKYKMNHLSAVYAGWIKTIIDYQQIIKKHKLNLNIPVLIYYSEFILDGGITNKGCCNDEVNYVKVYSDNIGFNVKELIIKNTVHDVFSSNEKSLKIVIKELFNWLNTK